MGGLVKAVTGSLGLSSGNAGSQPDIPAVVRPRDIINNILGVSTKEVTDENGNKSIVTDWVLSPEEEERMNALESSYDSWLSDLNSLSSITAAIEDPTYEPVVSALRENQRIARDEAYNSRTQLEEDTLARRGLADSQAGNQLRETRGADYQKQVVTDENNLALMAEDLRNQQYQRTANSLGFAANSLYQNKAMAVNQGNANASQQLSLFGTENNLNMQNASLLNQQWAQRVQQDQQIFSNLTGLATSAAFIGSGGMGGTLFGGIK